MSHLRQVLHLLKGNSHYCKLSKCSFFQPQTLYLGHVIPAQGIHADPEKVKVVQDWQVPKSRKQMMSFLGLSNYFKKYIPDYSTFTAPLVALTKPLAHLHMSTECLASFAELKTKLITAPVLVVPDDTQPYHLVCDALGVGTGAALFQPHGLISYFSYKMTPAETRYHTGEQELLGVIRALERFRPYLEGCSGLKMTTDHKPNLYLDGKTPVKTNFRQVRWMQLLSRFDFQWEWKKGSTNVADSLSRNPKFMASIVQCADFVPASSEFLEQISQA